METEVKSFEQVSATCDAAIGDCDIAITGLAVILNMNEHRIKVCFYETEKVDEFIKNKAKGTEVVRLSGPTAFKRWSPSSRSPRG